MSLMMLGTLPFIDKIGFDKGEIVGYTGIVLSFLLVFFGNSFLSGKCWRRQDHFRPSVRGRHTDHGDLVRLATWSPGRSSTSILCRVLSTSMQATWWIG